MKRSEQGSGFCSFVDMMRIIAITGGIGSGKSVVSTVLRKLGYAVYDCDSRAKCLMAESEEIHRELQETFGTGVVGADGTINSQELARRVFGDAEALARLNGIVHPRVRRDVMRWAEAHAERGVAFVETAILHESRMDEMVDEEWQVTAPLSVRVERVMKRNGMSEADVLARIGSQSSYTTDAPIVNDGYEALLPQIMQRLGQMNEQSKC